MKILQDLWAQEDQKKVVKFVFSELFPRYRSFDYSPLEFEQLFHCIVIVEVVLQELLVELLEYFFVGGDSA